MKPALAILGMLALCGASFGQGLINFINYHPPDHVDGRVYDSTGQPAGPDWLGQLYAAPPGGSLKPVGTPVPFSNNLITDEPTGIVSGGTVEIPFIPLAGAVDVQLRSWLASAGSTFEEALANASAEVSESNVITLSSIGGGLYVPVFLIGLGASHAFAIPEPSTWALMAVGLCVLLSRRSR